MINDNTNVENNSKKKFIVPIIIILVLIIIISVFLTKNMISNKKDSKSKSNEESNIIDKNSKKTDKSKENGEKNEQIEQQEEYKDDSYVCPEGLELLVDFIGYRGIFGPNNMLDKKDIRIQYIQFLLMKEKKVTWTNGDYQSFPYITEGEFKNKYNETFDYTVYNYDNDKDSNVFFDCNNYDETKNKNYKCWNGTWGEYGNKIYLYVKQNTTNVISGEYKRSSNESGTFEIEYTINNNKKYLRSIIMNNY